MYIYDKNRLIPFLKHMEFMAETNAMKSAVSNKKLIRAGFDE